MNEVRADVLNSLFRLLTFNVNIWFELLIRASHVDSFLSGLVLSVVPLIIHCSIPGRLTAADDSTLVIVIGI